MTTDSVVASHNARRLIGIAATTVLVGIALCTSGEPTLGGVVALASLIALIYGLHRFGRSGPDD